MRARAASRPSGCGSTAGQGPLTCAHPLHHIAGRQQAWPIPGCRQLHEPQQRLKRLLTHVRAVYCSTDGMRKHRAVHHAHKATLARIGSYRCQPASGCCACMYTLTGRRAVRDPHALHRRHTRLPVLHSRAHQAGHSKMPPLPAFDAMVIKRSSSCSIHSRTSSSPNSVLRSAGVRAAAMAWARASASAHTARVALRNTDAAGACLKSCMTASSQYNG